jgi:TrmH family RNA methyltransferase
VAVVGTSRRTLDDVLRDRPRLVTVLCRVADPGNAGTVIRTSDAAGAAAVALTRGSVDPYAGKCVRATAGSLFHLPVITGVTAAPTVNALREAGLTVLAATLDGDDLDALTDDELQRPTAWVFGSEAHGLDTALESAADRRVRVPIHGGAESLNLAAAAAVCLYASARAQHR